MSLILCDSCHDTIDSDRDPDCFVEVPWLNLADRVWCQDCREREWEKNDRDSEPSQARKRHADFNAFMDREMARQDGENEEGE